MSPHRGHLTIFFSHLGYVRITLRLSRGRSAKIEASRRLQPLVMLSHAVHQSFLAIDFRSCCSAVASKLTFSVRRPTRDHRPPSESQTRSASLDLLLALGISPFLRRGVPSRASSHHRSPFPKEAEETNAINNQFGFDVSRLLPSVAASRTIRNCLHRKFINITLGLSCGASST